MRNEKITSVGEDKFLPLELWTEVLARLPVKTLLRFKCVCKSWCSLIDTPDFISMHSTLFNTNENKNKNSHLRKTHLITVEAFRRKPIQLINIRGHKTCRKSAEAMKFIGESRIIGDYTAGVFLLVRGDSEMQLWNPSIRKYMAIPPCPLHPFNALDFLLGYHPSENAFKVVAVQCKDKGNHLGVVSCSITSIAAYVLGTTSWKTICVEVDDSWCFYKGFAFYSADAIHWLADTGRVDDSRWRRPTHIASFDWGSEGFSFMKLPCDHRDEIGGEETFHFPFLLGQSLAILEFSCLRANIWVLEKNKYDATEQSWIKWCSRDIPSEGYLYFKFLRGANRNMSYVKETGKFLMLMGDHTIGSYDLKNDVFDMNMFTSSAIITSVYPYFESLVLYDGLDDRTLTSFS